MREIRPAIARRRYREEKAPMAIFRGEETAKKKMMTEPSKNLGSLVTPRKIRKLKKHRATKSPASRAWNPAYA